MSWKALDPRLWREDAPPQGEYDVGDFLEAKDLGLIPDLVRPESLTRKFWRLVTGESRGAN